MHAVVVGDFGRDAGIRFCQLVAREERRTIVGDLGGHRFYDEHRPISLHLVGDLRFAKAELLSRWKGPLDDRVLVGFPGGPTLASVIPALGVLAMGVSP